MLLIFWGKYQTDMNGMPAQACKSLELGTDLRIEQKNGVKRLCEEDQPDVLFGRKGRRPPMMDQDIDEGRWVGKALAADSLIVAQDGEGEVIRP
ncbi:uncharacterized protein PAC_08256 [Phialocephala subalpina]|uniref:Uncharacterized protein n=1 Tax=Phialocephala subalpina TaxID=576137 RepID=A0A1L7X023_9HELO|nr:uncharacterized protein PAC_08256 [Phialocephala subalpina]